MKAKRMICIIETGSGDCHEVAMTYEQSGLVMAMLPGIVGGTIKIHEEKLPMTLRPMDNEKPTKKTH